MPKYGVTFTKYEYYEVEAENMDEAEDKAFEMLDADTWAFEWPVDKVDIKPIRSESMSKLLKVFENCDLLKQERVCIDCPYENMPDCKFMLYDNIHSILDELSKFIELKDIRNIKEIEIKEEENESKD